VETGALNALTLWRSWRAELDRERVRKAGELRELEPALDSLERFAESLGEREPEEQELERWTRRSEK
jgi:hypothetical protein